MFKKTLHYLPIYFVFTLALDLCVQTKVLAVDSFLNPVYEHPLDLENQSGSSLTQNSYFQEKLVLIAKRYHDLDYIPYVWGGNAIGSKDICLACQKCIIKKKPSVAKRLQRCAPCRECGMDCSHFVNRIYEDAGLSFPYATSRELARQSRSALFSLYSLIDIGKDLRHAQPGDILVYKHHIVMLTNVIDSNFGDFIHITRFKGQSRPKVGGFKWVKNFNLHKFRGKLIRILRHKQFFEDSVPFSFNNSHSTNHQENLSS
jgi:hypothetical protein